MRRLLPLFYGLLLTATCLAAAPRATGSPGQTPTDAATQRRLERIFAMVPEFAEVSVRVQEGVVELSGTTLSGAVRDDALELAATLDGVVYVVDELEQEADLERTLTPALVRLQDYVRAALRYSPLVLVAAALVALFGLLAALVGRWTAPFRYLRLNPLLQGLVQQLVRIVMFHCGSRYTYGSPRIHKDLQAAGHKVGRKRVACLMRSASIRGKTKQKFKTTTTSQHVRPKAANLVEQNVDVATPNTLWASDITYVPTAEGWLYLAVTLDLFSRKVVGWAFSDRLTDDLTLSALEMATQQRFGLPGLTHHSDGGSQYASRAFRAELEANRITQRLSGKGNCYDNAVVESFFATPSALPKRRDARETGS